MFYILNPKVDTPSFAATVAAVSLQLYQVDQDHQAWDLKQEPVLCSCPVCN